MLYMASIERILAWSTIACHGFSISVSNQDREPLKVPSQVQNLWNVLTSSDPRIVEIIGYKNAKAVALKVIQGGT